MQAKGKTAAKPDAKAPAKTTDSKTPAKTTDTKTPVKSEAKTPAAKTPAKTTAATTPNNKSTAEPKQTPKPSTTKLPDANKSTAKPPASKTTTTNAPTTKPSSTNQSALQSQKNSKSTLNTKTTTKVEAKPNQPNDDKSLKNQDSKTLTTKKTETKPVSKDSAHDKKSEAQKSAVPKKLDLPPEKEKKPPTPKEPLTSRSKKEKENDTKSSNIDSIPKQIDTKTKSPEKKKDKGEEESVKENKTDLEKSIISNADLKSILPTTNLEKLNSELLKPTKPGFESHKLHIEKTSFFPETIMTVKQPKKELISENTQIPSPKKDSEMNQKSIIIPKLENISHIQNDKMPLYMNKIDDNDKTEDNFTANSIQVDPDEIIHTKTQLFTKTYLLNPNTNTYTNINYDNLPRGRLMGKIISPNKKTTNGISIFSKYNLDHLFTANIPGNKNRVFFDKEFSYQQLSLTQVKEKSPFSNMNKSEHLNYLKELKNGYKANSDYSGILVPPNALTKNSLLSSENIFTREYNNILELQKLTSEVPKTSALTKKLNMTKRKILKTTSSPLISRDEKSMMNKEADMYVNFFDKIRKN